MNCANHTDVAAVAYCRTCGKALCANCTRDVQGTVYCESCLAARLNQPFTPGPQAAAQVPPQTFDGDAKPGLALALGMIPGVGAMYNGQFVKGIVHAMIFASCIFLADHGLGPIGGIGIMIWWFYMVFDAYTTAKARKYGQPLPDPFGFNRMFGANDPHFVNNVAAQGEVIGERMEQAVNQARQNWANRQGGAYPPPPAGTTYAPGSEEQQRQYAENLRAQVVNDANASAYRVPEPQTGIPTSAYFLIGIGVLFLLSTLDVFRFDVGRFWPVLLIGVGLWLLIKRRRTLGE
jgi:Domain of unknown function (DUF5668)